MIKHSNNDNDEFQVTYTFTNWSWDNTPGREGEQLVVGDVKDPQVLVSNEQSTTVLLQVVPCQIELLEGAEALLWLAAGRNIFQGICWHI